MAGSAHRSCSTQAASNSRRRCRRAAEQLDAFQHLILVRAIAGPAGRVGDLLHDVATSDDTTKHGVTPVEVAGGVFGDEELRTVGARTGIGHRQNPRPRVLQLGVELVLETIAWSAGAPTVRGTGVSAQG